MLSLMDLSERAADLEETFLTKIRAFRFSSFQLRRNIHRDSKIPIVKELYRELGGPSIPFLVEN
jgi:hypothetical protein